MGKIGKTSSELSPIELYHHCNRKLDNAKNEILSRWDDFLSKYDEQELVKDMITLMSSFSAKIYCRRSHENRKKNKC